ncbi:MAG: metalloprotease family protein, partial [Firmicutes bacterium]|nr:metalloprotease family protein [Bacillota bacterium]
MKNYESEIPQNYKLVKTIDAKSAKIGITLNLIALLVLIACVVSAYFIIGVPLDGIIDFEDATGNFIRLAVFIVVMISYVILHELVHGAAYKALTKQKLTFGLTLFVAFCGVPHIYVYRKTALIAVLAPFVTFLP